MVGRKLPYRKIARRYARLRLRPDRGRQEYRKKDEVCFLTKERREGKKESITLSSWKKLWGWGEGKNLLMLYFNRE